MSTRNRKVTWDEVDRRCREIAEQIAREHAEASWLAVAVNNRAYAGRWVALNGTELLAHGETAREVFAAVEGVKPTPLVVKVQEGDNGDLRGSL